MVALADPREGVAADGTIMTGAHRDRIPGSFAPVVDDAVASINDLDASLYLYGSVATGAAQLGASDVDFLSIDLSAAAEIGHALTARFSQLCRGVEIAAARSTDFDGDADEAYGNRVFLRHYCVHLAGPDPSADLPAFLADRRAARGFNGDLGRSLSRWRTQQASGALSAEDMGVRIARKSLLAVAGMVSVHDGTWTTDRVLAARRWSEIEPELAPGLSRLADWVAGSRQATPLEAAAVLEQAGLISAIVERFESLVGLWR